MFIDFQLFGIQCSANYGYETYFKKKKNILNNCNDKLQRL